MLKFEICEMRQQKHYKKSDQNAIFSLKQHPKEVL